MIKMRVLIDFQTFKIPLFNQKCASQVSRNSIKCLHLHIFFTNMSLGADKKRVATLLFCEEFFFVKKMFKRRIFFYNIFL